MLVAEEKKQHESKKDIGKPQTLKMFLLSFIDYIFKQWRKNVKILVWFVLTNYYIYTIYGKALPTS